MKIEGVMWGEGVPGGELAAMQREAEAAGRECLVGGLIANAEGRIFVQKRSAQRKLLPNCWDIVGGHVEPGETLEAALAREIEEETGWTLQHMGAPVAVMDWSVEQAGVMAAKREFDFLVVVGGDLAQPRIEQGKVSEYRWVGEDDLPLLAENRQPSDTVVVELVRQALRLAGAR